MNTYELNPFSQIVQPIDNEHDVVMQYQQWLSDKEKEKQRALRRLSYRFKWIRERDRMAG